MRVVGGSARGKSLFMVPGRGTRPITDRVKTSLFDILRPRLQGVNMLDLFAGTGSVGIEALSQGAAHCTFLDTGDLAIAVIKKNLAHTRLFDRALVKCADALKFLKKTEKTFDLIYVAPPQYKNLWTKSLHLIAERPEILRKAPDGSDDDQDAALVIAQIDRREYEELDLGAIRETRQRRYGNTLLVFYEPAGTPSPRSTLGLIAGADGPAGLMTEV
jgi:16S rRNA (guanine966-N2)-methyltransferase